MDKKAKWCFLCDRYVVPKKSFSSVGWVGFVGTLALVVASVSIEPLSRSTTTNVIAQSLQTGMGNIILNVLVLLLAPLLLISIVYCVHYAAKKPRCPICNAKISAVETASEPTVVRAEPDYPDTTQLEKVQ